MKKYLFIPLLFTSMITLFQSVHAAPATDAAALSQQWAQIVYEEPQNRRKLLLETLYKEARVSAAEHSDNEDILSWAGIITASYAGAKGGLGALKLAKEARGFLETALDINPEALSGGARTSLGVLYYQVPPWPVGFGNTNRAEKLLAESYDKHPTNLDVVFFYADFLHSQKRFTGARNLLQKAQLIPIRPHRELADTGRLQQVAKKLAEIDAATS